MSNNTLSSLRNSQRFNNIENKGVINLAELSWMDVAALSKEKTVFFVPLGPIEAHGPHLPLGTDIFIAIQIAKHAAKIIKEKNPNLSAVITPEIPFGFADLGAALPGNICIRQSTLKALIIDMCENLAKHGIKYIVIVNCHLAPRHLVAIDEGIQEVMEKYNIRIISPCIALFINGDLAREIARSTNKMAENFMPIGKYNGHGGALETSVIMYKYPELLNKEALKVLPAKQMSLRRGLKGAKSFKEMGMELGYTGNPKLATEDLGKIFLESFGSVLSNITIEMLEGKDVSERTTTIFSNISMFHTEEWRNRKERHLGDYAYHNENFVHF